MSNITITLANFNRFSKRLQKILTNKTQQQFGYSETQEILSQTLGAENLYEMQQALKKETPLIASINDVKKSFLQDFQHDCYQMAKNFPETVGLVQIIHENGRKYSTFDSRSFIIRVPLKTDTQQMHLHFAGGGQSKTLTDKKHFDNNMDITDRKMNGMPEGVKKAITQIFQTYVEQDNGEFLEICLMDYMRKNGIDEKNKKTVMLTDEQGIILSLENEPPKKNKRGSLKVTSLKLTSMKIKN